MNTTLETLPVFYPSLMSEQRSLPLEEVDLNIKLDKVFANAKLSQKFVNVYQETLELTYTFPLPPLWAVSNFTAVLGGRKIKGVIEERQAAQKSFTSALNEGKRAALMEEERSNVFTLTLGNVAPGEEVKIDIKLNGFLSVDDAVAELLFPTVVPELYVDSQELTPDAEKVIPSRRNLFEKAPRFKTTIKVRKPLTNFNSTWSFNRTETKKWVKFVSSEIFNKNLVFSYPLPAEDASLVYQQQADGGFWALLKAGPKRKKAPSRTVAFLIDNSGSMGGWSIIAARKSCASLIESLTESDFFSLKAFNSVVETPPGLEEVVPATGLNRSIALKWLRALQAHGGTEIYQPLTDTLTSLKGLPGEKSVVLLTDAYVSGENRIVADALDKASGARIHTIGVGANVNVSMLMKLSTPTGGFHHAVHSLEQLDESMRKISSLLLGPSLTNLTLASSKADLSDVTGLTDLYEGSSALMLGRFEGTFDQLVLEGVRSSNGKSFKEELQPQESAVDLSSLWARRRILDLEDAFDLTMDNTIKNEILTLSKQFKVLSRFSAFLAVDKEKQTITSSVKKTQPSEMPTGFSHHTVMAGSFAQPNTGVMINAVAAAPIAAATTRSLGKVTPQNFTAQNPIWEEAAAISMIPKTLPDVSNSLSFTSMVSTESKVILVALRKALEEKNPVRVKALLSELKNTNNNGLYVPLELFVSSYLDSDDDISRKAAINVIVELLKQ